MAMNSLVKLTEASSGDSETEELGDGYEFNEGDEVVRLREWGTHRMLPLRAPTGRSLHADSVSAVALQLSSRCSARGLELAYESRSWRIKDWAGVANLKQDGAATREVTLVAGTEVSIAGKTLIAESPRTLELRDFCSRLLGWSDDHIGVVDQVMRTIRLANTGRAALVLRGRGDMVPIAFAIHRRVLEKAAPFLVSDPRRGNTPATVRGPANCVNGMVAFRKGFGGTLCVRAERLPSDFDEVLQAFREPDSGVRLVICSSGSVRNAFSTVTLAAIEVPSLDTRRDELARIVHEYAVDAIESLCAPRNCLHSQDLAWVSQLPHATLSGIERTLQRVVAIKTSRNLSEAAKRLTMAPVSLFRWLARREQFSKTSALYLHALVKHWRRKRRRHA